MYRLLLLTYRFRGMDCLYTVMTKRYYSLVPNVTHRSIETHACTLGKSIGLNYPHALTNGKLLCGKKYTTNNFVSHNPIETHDFKISSCQKCDFQLNHTSDLHFQIGMIQIKHTPVSGFGLILINTRVFFMTLHGLIKPHVLNLAPESSH